MDDFEHYTKFTICVHIVNYCTGDDGGGGGDDCNGDAITVTCCVDSKTAVGSGASEKALPVVRSAPSLQQVASYSTSDSRQVFLSSVLVMCQYHYIVD